ncbi:hypothetical protein [Kitasatospora sp. MAP5-34]|uniref:hypothetical protein n=1 Tax=Kitasatospora sp. MAP5-34 TaxID=3035102 RepID=UPI002475BC58|nr:hypothetical protein [Kitasatospora sp. MAP5-34]MDH6577400.1 hypothetical protein [Kitasatospora sp. MAP5-34]
MISQTSRSLTAGRRRRPRLAVTVALGVAAALSMAGCASGTGQPGPAKGPTTAPSAAVAVGTPSGTPTGTPVAGATGTPTPAGTTPGAPAGTTVALTEHDSGRTVTVPVGSTVQLVLHSTFWAGPTSSAPKLLSAAGTPARAAGSGTGCHPGSGCGTVTAGFLARSAGTAQLTSMRTSCGEAMACTPALANFAVTVVVVAH